MWSGLCWSTTIENSGAGYVETFGSILTMHQSATLLAYSKDETWLTRAAPVFAENMDRLRSCVDVALVYKPHPLDLRPPTVCSELIDALGLAPHIRRMIVPAAIVAETFEEMDTYNERRVLQFLISILVAARDVDGIDAIVASFLTARALAMQQRASDSFSLLESNILICIVHGIELHRTIASVGGGDPRIRHWQQNTLGYSFPAFFKTRTLAQHLISGMRASDLLAGERTELGRAVLANHLHDDIEFARDLEKSLAMVTRLHERRALNRPAIASDVRGLKRLLEPDLVPESPM